LKYARPIESLSIWFTNEKVIPNIGEHLFVNDNWEDQARCAGSYEWIVVGKFFDSDKLNLYWIPKDAIIVDKTNRNIVNYTHI
jgi:hypothetical protein